MEKKPTNVFCCCFRDILQKFRKLISVNLFVCVLLLTQTNVQAQSNNKISLDLKNIEIEKVFEQVENSTNFRFLYNVNSIDLKRKISLQVQNESLDSVLKKIFNGTNTSYEILDKQIVLKKTSQKIQKKSVSGLINDENNIPLAGVTILIKGTKKGTISDFDGNFSIDTKEGDVLVFSYLGYDNFEKTINSATNYTIQMVPGAEILAEVEIFSDGYQKISKERATGSFSKVKQAVVDTKINQNLVSKLSGEVPGLLFDQQEGILIRGIGSINGNNSPLLVVDGIALDESASIADINPNDVESVTVLKDAAAASIWGIRAASGVIVITTKKGKRNQKISITGSAVSSVTPKYDLYNNRLADTYTQINYKREVFSKIVGDFNPNDFYTGPGLNNEIITKDFLERDPVTQTLIYGKTGEYTQGQVNTILNNLALNDVRKEFSDRILRPKLWNQYNLAIAGGGEKQDFRASISFNDNQSERINNDSKQIIANFRNSINISEKLKANFIINYSTLKDNSGPSTGNSIFGSQIATGRDLLNDIPLYSKIVDANSNYLPMIGGANQKTSDFLRSRGFLHPFTYNVFEEYENANNTYENTSFRFQTAFDYKINNDLDFTVAYQYTTDNSRTRNLYNENTFATRSLINFFTQVNEEGTGIDNSLSSPYAVPQGAILDNFHSDASSQTFRAQLNFDKTFEDGLHQLTAIAGYEARKSIQESNGNRLFGYDDQALTFGRVNHALTYNNIFASDAEISAENLISSGNSIDYLERRFLSYYANAAYTYDYKYTLTASTRLDDTNLFGASDSFRNIPMYSFGGKWNLHEEFFSESDDINSLAFRATYGVNGNVGSSNAGQYLLADYYTNSNVYTHNAARISNIPNSVLQLEKVKTTNIGVDFGFLNNRFSGSVEYYNSNSENLFLDQSVNPTLGVSSQGLNVGSLNNQGLDFTINYDLGETSYGLKYNTSLIASFNKNKLTSVEFDPSDFNSYLNGNITILGKALNTIYSYRYAGLDTSGKPQFFDENGAVIDYTRTIGNTSALKEEGTQTPIYYGSWINEFAYKRMSLRILTSYKAGHVFRFNNRYIPSQGIVNVTNDFNNRWQAGTNENSNIPGVPTPEEILNPGYTHYQNIDSFVDNASTIEINQISFGYSFPKSVLKKSGLESLSLGLQMDNVAIWNFNKWNVNPNSQFTPIQKTVSLNLNTRF